MPTPTAWNGSRSHHLRRQETDSFSLNVSHSNGPFPTGINLRLFGYHHPKSNSFCHALGYIICLMYNASKPHRTDLLNAEKDIYLYFHFCCIHFLYPPSSKCNTVIVNSSFTFYTHNSAPLMFSVHLLRNTELSNTRKVSVLSVTYQPSGKRHILTGSVNTGGFFFLINSF